MQNKQILTHVWENIMKFGVFKVDQLRCAFDFVPKSEGTKLTVPSSENALTPITTKKCSKTIQEFQE